MNRVKNNIKKEFTIAPNSLINDDSLTDRARFLFIYMASKPDDWIFYNASLSKSLKYSIDTLRKYILELRNSGWITKEMQIRNEGKFSANIYILNPSPILNSPCRDFSESVKNQYGKTPSRKNTESVKNRVGKTMTLNNKDSNKKIKTKKNNLTKGIKILK